MSDIEQDIEDNDAYYAEYIINADLDEKYYEDDDDYEEDNRNYDIEDFNETVGENSIYGKYLKDDIKSALNYSRQSVLVFEIIFQFSM